MNGRNILLMILVPVLAACAGSAGRLADAEAERKQSEINTALGREYLERGQYEIALEKLKKATSFDPSYAPAHTMLAVLYERINDSGLAERHYRLAIEAAPGNGDVNNNFGVFLCQTGRANEAGEYFRRAVEDPFYRTPAASYANAGSCELQMGNLDKAETYLRKSLDYDAEFSDALLAMANVRFLKDEYFGARAFLQRYEGTGPDTAESLALGARIESSLNNGQVAREYIAQLMSQFPDSMQAGEIRDQETRNNSRQ
jgi:type IV pilus assembly protein PilF